MRASALGLHGAWHHLAAVNGALVVAHRQHSRLRWMRLESELRRSCFAGEVLPDAVGVLEHGDHGQTTIAIEVITAGYRGPEIAAKVRLGPVHLVTCDPRTAARVEAITDHRPLVVPPPGALHGAELG